MQTLHNVRVFDGETIQQDRRVGIAEGRITSVGADEGPLPAAGAHRDGGGGLLAPGFIDVQVNGGGGVLLNDAPEVEGLRRIAETHRRYGTTGLFPTLISDHPAVTRRAVDAARAALHAGVPGVLGLHLEGPYLNPERSGIHPTDRLRRPDPADRHWLQQQAADLPLIMTLAPECVPEGFIRGLTGAGIRVSAGHTAADHVTLRRALDEGLSGFTHLFNAMSPLTAREPGTVGTALADAESYCGLILDGVHVHPESAMVALRAKRPGRVMLVTDAVHLAATEMERSTLLGRPIVRAQGRVTAADGTLAGSDLTMDRAVRNAVDLLGLPLTEALRMASLTPAAFLGLDDQVGRIRPGYRADLVLLDDALRVRRTWIGGSYRDH
ncbi:N-acetylglucosamine-6-phosphate deacetylase [Arhodomonas sp. SL1]|uniref:N-acetylglucosamine-6-phosphate deacetylase n=1 Tax=Arhodomonas sp. SL1 TaxID=3425691 RepID=UPI003F8831FD